MQILDELLLKDKDFNEDILSQNLYISYGKYSALRKEYKNVLKHIKVYTNYKILNEKTTNLPELHKEELFLVKTNKNELFIRLVYDDGKLMDILIYTYEKNLEYLNNFFRKEEIIIPTELKKIYDNAKTAVIIKKDNNKTLLVKATKSFYEIIKYEDWDYQNKFQNLLDSHILSLSEEANYVNVLLKDSEGKEIAKEFKYMILDDYELWFI